MKARTALVVGAAVGVYLGVRLARGRSEQVDAAVGRVRARLSLGEEPSWEPGLEFNPDFSPTPDEIEADLRGDAPSV